MHSALIIIDVQQGFINEHTKDLPQKIADHIQNNHYDFIIFTTFINQSNSNFQKILGYHDNSTEEELFIPDELREIAHKHSIFIKSTYSVFGSKELREFLQGNQISTLFLCGIDLDGCVLASAYQAFDEGFNVVIIPELSKSSGGEIFDNAAEIIISRNLMNKSNYS